MSRDPLKGPKKCVQKHITVHITFLSLRSHNSLLNMHTS